MQISTILSTARYSFKWLSEQEPCRLWLYQNLTHFDTAQDMNLGPPDWGSNVLVSYCPNPQMWKTIPYKINTINSFFIHKCNVVLLKNMFNMWFSTLQIWLVTMRSKDGKVYIGGLLDTVQREELQKELARFGHVTECWVAHNPPGFAFAEFASANDAETAVTSLDGKNICGSRVRVEMSHSDGPKFDSRPRRPLLGDRSPPRVPIRRPLSLLPTQHQRRPLLGAQGRLRVVKRLSARRPLLSTPVTLPYVSTHSAHQIAPRRRQLLSQPYRRMSPEPYRRMSPEPYRRMSPDPYRRMSPDPYHEMSLEPYREMSPEPYRQQVSLPNSRHALLHSRRAILPLPDVSRRSLLPLPDGGRRGILLPPDDFHRALLPLPDDGDHGPLPPPRRPRQGALSDLAHRHTLSPPRHLPLPLHTTVSTQRRLRRGILPPPNTEHHPALSSARRSRHGILPSPDGIRRGGVPRDNHAMSPPPRRSHRTILPLPVGVHHTSSPPRHTRRPILPLPDTAHHATSPGRRRRAILSPPNSSRHAILPPPRGDGCDHLHESHIISSRYECKPRHYPEEQPHCDAAHEATYRAKAPLLATPTSTPQYRSRSALIPRHRYITPGWCMMCFRLCDHYQL